MKLSEMRRILADRAIQLTKSLGQNFLHDANQLRRIVEAAELSPRDKVLEIGPGLGPLTERLLEHVGEVLAIEKDLRLVAVLRDRFGASGACEPTAPRAGEPAGPARGRLRLEHDDALDYLRGPPRDWTGWKLVANLPYSVASPILVELAQAERGPERMVATLQIEVAKRLMAGAGEPDFGVLTLLVQLGYAPRGWFKIPASCFFPEPEVDSACICLERRKESLLEGRGRIVFVRVVKRAFSQRRKKMFKLLKEDWPAPQLERAFAQSGVDTQARAEAVSLEQFVRLAQCLDAC
jgi:16S rRNA (adenine1518-N6/adenine1519-N6)-dimethyltransferase